MDSVAPTDHPLLRLGGEDGFELDAAALELRKGGEPVEIEPRPFRLLQYLVQHRGRVVPKDELLDEVWDGVAVSDAALSTAIKHVRRALGDRGTESRWIESRRGRGYRFVAEVLVPTSIEWMRAPSGAYGDAHDASLRSVRRSLEVLGDVAPGKTRDQLELEMQMILARALSAAKGWAAETVEAWEQASELATRAGDTRRTGIVRFGLAAGLLTLGRIDEALVRYEDVMRLGLDTEDRMLQVAGCIRGLPQMYLGRPRDAAASLRAGIALIRDDDDYLGSGFSEDFAVSLRHWLSWPLWLLGEADAAWQSAREALEVARRGDSHMLGYTLNVMGVVAMLRDDWSTAEALANEALALAKKEEYPLIEALSRMECAAAIGLNGEARDAGRAADDFVAAITSMGDSGNRSGAGLMLSFLARLQLHAGRFDEAGGTIGLALGMSPETGPFFDAELLRLRAEVEYALGDGDAARASLDAARSVARAQGASAFEARIEASRSRLCEG